MNFLRALEAAAVQQPVSHLTAAIQTEPIVAQWQTMQRLEVERRLDEHLTNCNGCGARFCESPNKALPGAIVGLAAKKASWLAKWKEKQPGSFVRPVVAVQACCLKEQIYSLKGWKNALANHSLNEQERSLLVERVPPSKLSAEAEDLLRCNRCVSLSSTDVAPPQSKSYWSDLEVNYLRSKIKPGRSVIFCVVDLFDFPATALDASFFGRYFEEAETPIVLIGNKLDLLLDLQNHNHHLVTLRKHQRHRLNTCSIFGVRQWLRATAMAAGMPAPEKVILTSSVTGYGIEELRLAVAKATSRLDGQTAFFVGCTNVGKSSLWGAIMADVLVRPTVSCEPGTTAGFLQVPSSSLRGGKQQSSGFVCDTPGLLRRGSCLAVAGGAEALLPVDNVVLPCNYLLASGDVLAIDAYCRVEFESSKPDDRLLVTTSLSQRLQARLLRRGLAESVAQSDSLFLAYEKRDYFSLERLKSNLELALSGLGTLNFAGSVSNGQLRIFYQTATGVFPRVEAINGDIPFIAKHRRR